MYKVLPFNRTPEEENQITLFYLERILELTEEECYLLAQKHFKNYKARFRSLLNPDHFEHIAGKVNQEDNWSFNKEQTFLERMENAYSFNEHKSVHDFANEILLHHDHRADSCPTHKICNRVNEVLALNNAQYVEPDEVNVNTFVDAEIQFVVEKRRPSRQSNKNLEGNPGFYLNDVMGRRYRCFVKQIHEAQVGDRYRLKITNIPGPALTNGNHSEPIIYLEPRVEPGETIEVELASLSHTGNSFTFRHYSYDGFLWFKRRGVNKEIFNKNTLRPNDRIIAKVLYTSEEEKRTDNGKVTRLGIIKAIPIRRAEQEHQEHDRDNNAAKALN